jgi:hypothetical protein
MWSKGFRRYFLYDRRLLSDLSRCGWESLKAFFQETVPEEDAVPGAVIAIQSFGDFLGFNPHLHVLCSDGCFYGEGVFKVAPRFPKMDLEEIFRHKVFKMLLSKGKITKDLVQILMSWRHSGFNVFEVGKGYPKSIGNRYRIHLVLTTFLGTSIDWFTCQSRWSS